MHSSLHVYHRSLRQRWSGIQGRLLHGNTLRVMRLDSPPHLIQTYVTEWCKRCSYTPPFKCAKFPHRAGQVYHVKETASQEEIKEPLGHFQRTHTSACIYEASWAIWPLVLWNVLAAQNKQGWKRMSPGLDFTHRVQALWLPQNPEK